MSDKRIIYKNTDSSVSSNVSIIIPTAEALQSMTIEQIAQKDVPTGRPYKIVNASEISTDRTFRDAWDIDEAELTDGVGN